MDTLLHRSVACSSSCCPEVAETYCVNIVCLNCALLTPNGWYSIMLHFVCFLWSWFYWATRRQVDDMDLAGVWSQPSLHVPCFIWVFLDDKIPAVLYSIFAPLFAKLLSFYRSVLCLLLGFSLKPQKHQSPRASVPAVTVYVSLCSATVGLTKKEKLLSTGQDGRARFPRWKPPWPASRVK